MNYEHQKNAGHFYKESATLDVRIISARLKSWFVCYTSNLDLFVIPLIWNKSIEIIYDLLNKSYKEGQQNK